jgi:nitroreductase
MRKLTIPSLFIAFCCVAVAQELQPVNLPPPQMAGGMPLLQALHERKSQREFAPDPLPPQVLSNLLWAAWGVNRPDSGKRTAPSAMNRQEMDVYVALASGTYLYEAPTHRLLPVVGDDLRALTGGQAYVGTAPVNLVYVARVKPGAGQDWLTFDGALAGFIGENVYLFCASEGLATVVRGMVDRDALAKAMKLGPDQKIILAQTVGFPKKK